MPLSRLPSSKSHGLKTERAHKQDEAHDKTPFTPKTRRMGGRAGEDSFYRVKILFCIIFCTLIQNIRSNGTIFYTLIRIIFFKKIYHGSYRIRDNMEAIPPYGFRSTENSFRGPFSNPPSTAVHRKRLRP